MKKIFAVICVLVIGISVGFAEGINSHGTISGRSQTKLQELHKVTINNKITCPRGSISSGLGPSYGGVGFNLGIRIGKNLEAFLGLGIPGAGENYGLRLLANISNGKLITERLEIYSGVALYKNLVHNWHLHKYISYSVGFNCVVGEKFYNFEFYSYQLLDSYTPGEYLRSQEIIGVGIAIGAGIFFE